MNRIRLAFITPNKSSQSQPAYISWFAAVCGLTTVAVLPYVSEAYALSHASYTERAVTRTVIAIVWLLPIGNLLCEVALRSSSQFDSLSSWRWLLMSAAIALGLPAVYVHVQLSSMAEAYEQTASRQRLMNELELASSCFELRGDCALRQGQLYEIVRRLKRQVKQLSDEVSVPIPRHASVQELQMRALQLLSLGRPQDALQLVNEHHEHATTGNIDWWIIGSLAARELKRWDDVCTYAQKVLQHSPGNSVALELYGEAEAAQHRFEQAIAVYEQLLSSTRDSHDGTSSQQIAAIQVRLAQLSMDCGKAESARHYMRSALQTDQSIEPQIKSLERTVLQSSCAPNRLISRTVQSVDP